MKLKKAIKRLRRRIYYMDQRLILLEQYLCAEYLKQQADCLAYTKKDCARESIDD